MKLISISNSRICGLKTDLNVIGGNASLGYLFFALHIENEILVNNTFHFFANAYELYNAGSIFNDSMVFLTNMNDINHSEKHDKSSNFQSNYPSSLFQIITKIFSSVMFYSHSLTVVELISF